MITEDRKFLDLDQVCDQIISDSDRLMFNEAVRCYQIGSHRAAIILAWCVTADCLYRRIDELASEGDENAKKARIKLSSVEGQTYYEENLITQAKICELFDDYDDKSLRFVRDIRSKCAHPTGVVPSAEAVRHILYICSQTVLCREGYRGMSFIRHFVQTTLDDPYLFSNNNHVSDTCKYYFSKVPDRIRPQFAACCVDKIRESCSPHWKTNSFCFLKELMNYSTSELSLRTAQKLREIEGLDRKFFSVLVGIDQSGIIWDTPTRIQAKAHLRESLKLGKVDQFEFQSYATLCCIGEFEDEDKELFKEKFLPFSKYIPQHILLQKSRRIELISIVIDSFKDDESRQKILTGVASLVSAELFSQEVNEISQFVECLIESDWREDVISTILDKCSDWSDLLKVIFLRNSESFLAKCSEDFPDDMLILFDVASRLLYENPLLLPSQFENALMKIIIGDIRMDWFEDKGTAWECFVGQVELIKLRYGAHLPILSTLTLPNPDEPEELEEIDE